MRHIVLALPFLGLLLFLFLPWELALAINIPITLLSLFIFFVIMKTLRSPINTGPFGIVGGTGEVLSKLDGIGPANYLVFFQGETWSAISKENLLPGERVRIISLLGIKPVVVRESLTAFTRPPRSTKTGPPP